MKAILTIGPAASGKSTWATDYIYHAGFKSVVEINRDTLRWQICGEESWEAWQKWSRVNDGEKQVTKLVYATIDDCYNRNVHTLIISDTNLNKKFREQLVRKLYSLCDEVEFKEFHTSFEECCKRDAARPNGVGVSVIAKQFEMFQQYLRESYPAEHVVINDKELPPCIIVDIDGTLAIKSSGRSPYDWSRVGEDSVNEAMMDILEWCTGYSNFFGNSTDIVILSGRDESCRKETEEWLTKNGICYQELHMRPEGDFRKDTVIKREMFDKYIAGKYYVKAVFDDRPSVVRMWRSMGFTTFALGNQHIEF